MKYFTVYFFFWAIISNTLLAQIPSIVPRSKQVPATYKTSYEKEFEQTSYFTNAAGIKGQEADYVNFCLASAKTEALNYGDVYYDWQEAEEYLNKIMGVLAKQAGDTLKYRPKVYLAYDASFNAYALHDGSLFFHVGSFLYLDNEAEIAAILAHELAHYLKQHVVKSAAERIRTDYASLNTNKKRTAYKLNLLANSRASELEADSIGFIIFSRSGYATDSYLAAEEKLNNYSKSFDRFVAMRLQSQSTSLSTHPPGEQRIAIAKRGSDAVNDKSSNTFIVSDKTFQTIKKQARVEVLQDLLTNGDYVLCMETAFVNYLGDTSDNNNVYYVLESLRRFCFSSDINRNSTFISNFYSISSLMMHNNTLVNSFFTGLTIPSVMKRLDKLMPADKIQLYVQDKHLLEHPNDVHSCEKAVKYFEKIAVRRKITECYLSLALFYHETEKKFATYINNYVSANGNYSDYAQWILNAREEKPKKTEKTAVILNFHSVDEYLNKVEVYGYLDYEKLEKDLFELIKTTSKEEGREFFRTTELMENNVDIYRAFQLFAEVIEWSDPNAVQVGNKPQQNTSCISLYYFDPIFYYLFIKNGVYDEVVFVNVFDQVKLLKTEKLPVSDFKEVDFTQRVAYYYKLKSDVGKKFTSDSYKKSEHKMSKFY